MISTTNNVSVAKWYIKHSVLTTYYPCTLQVTQKVKERESGVDILTFSVTDKDSPGSPAWKAKLNIVGDPDKYFKIHIDPETNQGNLTLIKVLLCCVLFFIFKEICKLQVCRLSYLDIIFPLKVNTQ